MVPDYILIIAYFLLVGITGYYSIQTRGMLKEMKRSREAQYAAQTRSEIYEPLYGGVKKMHNSLEEEFSFPPDYRPALRVWDELKPSIKLRAPRKLAELIEKFNAKAREFYELRANYKINEILLDSIRKKFRKFSDLDESWEDPEPIVVNIFHSYKKDFLAGRILELQNRPELKELLRTDQESTAKKFFGTICSSIKSNRTIIEIRKKQKEFIEGEVKDLETYLERKINYILQKYESKLIKI